MDGNGFFGLLLVLLLAAITVAIGSNNRIEPYTGGKDEAQDKPDAPSEVKPKGKPWEPKKLPKHLEREASRLVAAALVKAEVGLYMDAPPVPAPALVALAWTGGQLILPWIYQEGRISAHGLAVAAFANLAVPDDDKEADEMISSKFYAYALGRVIKSFPNHTAHFDHYPGDDHIYREALAVLQIAAERNADELQELQEGGLST